MAEDIRVAATRTESGLIVPADALEEVPPELSPEELQQQEELAALRERVTKFHEELQALDPQSRLLRKLDMLLMQWLPQQEEWILLVGGNDHASRRGFYKALARAVAKRMTTIPHRPQF